MLARSFARAGGRALAGRPGHCFSTTTRWRHSAVAAHGTAAPDLPLAGYRVLDMTRVLAGVSDSLLVSSLSILDLIWPFVSPRAAVLHADTR